jgi:nicotinamidase/pyrazinamidase
MGALFINPKNMNAPKKDFTPLENADDMQAFLQEGGVVVGVDVDTQRDFAQEGGALYVPTSEEVKTNLARLTDELRIRIGSVDSHAFDAWEFQSNGGPFPEHCVKGTEGWLKIPETQRGPTRFIPMTDGHLVVGENIRDQGNRQYSPQFFASEVVDKGVAGIFEKEVYSMFANPNAEKFIAAIVRKIEEDRSVTRDKILFAVYGHCTGGYCVDAAADGLREKGYRTAIIEDATAPLNIGHSGESQDGEKVSRANALKKNIHILNTNDVLSLANKLN